MYCNDILFTVAWINTLGVDVTWITVNYVSMDAAFLSQAKDMILEESEFVIIN